MARGWESKSVEQQQAERTTDSAIPRPPLSSADAARQKRKGRLELARKHTAQQLELARNPNHRKVLEEALAALDAQLSKNE